MTIITMRGLTAVAGGDHCGRRGFHVGAGAADPTGKDAVRRRATGSRKSLAPPSAGVSCSSPPVHAADRPVGDGKAGADASRVATAVRRFKTSDPFSAALMLAAISFAYGVLHAAGPGHGKAVISSYVLADGNGAARHAAVVHGGADTGDVGAGAGRRAGAGAAVDGTADQGDGSLAGNAELGVRDARRRVAAVLPAAPGVRAGHGQVTVAKDHNHAHGSPPSR